MIGGLIKTNRIAALAGAGVIAGALSVSPAQAADLGGDCCADLEERVATLEATTARKGNRKVSLTISGWVNSAVMIWDDGVDTDAYALSDNGATLGSRVTFAGDAKINHDWSAGYNITIEVQSADPFLGDFLSGSGNLGASQANDDGSNNFSVLYSYMWIKSERYGELALGKQSQATDNISIVDLSGTLFSGNNVLFRGNSFATTNSLWAFAVGCSGIGTDCHGEPSNVLKYTTPTFSGFTLSASWGEDDFYDVAVKYAGEFGDFKVGAAGGYSVWNGGDKLRTTGLAAPSESELLEFGASIMHTPTGIFVSGTYSNHKSDNANVEVLDNDAWYIKAGIKQRWNSLGATAIYGEYARYADGFDASGFGLDAADQSAVDRYGVGVHQWIDAAAMQVYFNWTHLEVDGSNGTFVDGEELDTFTLGGVIFF
ncbi:MAG: hypothetical protein DHS20C08_02280 [Rhodomicrobium sp.]|nr:MAG: hypothetical protein DHS20C08_02280 [Rhodomicrobium sp.]